MCRPQGEPVSRGLTENQIADARSLARSLADRAMGTARSASEILESVLELLEDERRWLARWPSGIATEDYAFRPDGTSTWWGDREAVQWCIGGAMGLCTRSPASNLPSPRIWPEPVDFDDTPTSDERIQVESYAYTVLQEELGMHVVAVTDHGHTLRALRRSIDRTLTSSASVSQTP